jgi:Leucine-rich repeat (LRR) protein
MRTISSKGDILLLFRMFCKTFYLWILVVGETQNTKHLCPIGCTCFPVENGTAEEDPLLKADCKYSYWNRIPYDFDANITILDMTVSRKLVLLLNNSFSAPALANLEQVILQGCSIKFIEQDGFRHLEKVTRLHLGQNRIETLELEVFAWTVRLRELWLWGNPLKQLSGAFPPLNQLASLDMDDCRLSSIPAQAFHNLQSLEELGLAMNRFKRLINPTEVFCNLSNLKNVRLEWNPWICDCHLMPLLEMAFQMPDVFFSGLSKTNNKCSEPDRVSGIPWDKIEIRNICLQDKLQIPWLRIVVLTTLALLTVFISIISCLHLFHKCQSKYKRRPQQGYHQIPLVNFTDCIHRVEDTI